MTFYFPPLLCSGHHHTAAMTSWRARRGRSSSLACSLFAYPPTPLPLCPLMALRSTHGLASPSTPHPSSLARLYICRMLYVRVTLCLGLALALSPPSLHLALCLSLCLPICSSLCLVAVDFLPLSVCARTHVSLVLTPRVCVFMAPHVFMASCLPTPVSCLASRVYPVCFLL